jgi:hypothetical protein
MVDLYMNKLAPLLVWILSAEDFAVALAYVYARDWRMAIYWAAAGVICAAVPK